MRPTEAMVAIEMRSHTSVATVAITGTVILNSSLDDFHLTSFACPGPTELLLFFKNWIIRTSKAMPVKETTRTRTRWITESINTKHDAMNLICILLKIVIELTYNFKGSLKSFTVAHSYQRRQVKVFCR